MSSSRISVLSVVLFALIFGGRIPCRARATDEVKALVTFGDGFDLAKVKAQDAQVQCVPSGSSRSLRVATGHEAEWPGVTFQAPDGVWLLSAFSHITATIRNVDSEPLKLFCRVDGPGGQEEKNSVSESIELKPGETGDLVVPLRRKLPPALAEKLFGMRGDPGGSKEKGIDGSKITQMIFFMHRPNRDFTFELTDIRATGRQDRCDWMDLPPDQFFPMIDQLGQFAHKSWPGKTPSVEELKASIANELVDLKAHPGPAPWNEFGGWRTGPQMERTGFFYPLKHRGKWWLVDPQGRLFWSHGVDCVSFSQGATPITDREFYFAELPPDDSPLARFYGKGSWAPHGYYQGKGTYRTYNFAGANLMRKYGEDWYDAASDACHRRLRSWSMNTIANWSDSNIYLKRRTAYVVSVSYGSAQAIEGSSGYWGQFPDPFDGSFRDSLERRMRREKDRTAGDPWCIGYFVDNELGWGDEQSLAEATLASPPEQAAKRVFISDLKKKYGKVDALNAAWGAEYGSWDALLESRTPPENDKAHDDLAAFYSRIADQYFRTCRDIVKETAPKNLYLGCRFAWVNDRVVREAARYCDVIGYNLYRDSVAEFRLPEGVDKPAIIGEFHFGALDRGMFHTGLRPTASQDARAKAYRDYVTGALKNPVLVGSHWFQYGDQAATGRGDGENYQIGLIDVCDRPYPETIRAVREVGDSLYRTRFEGGKE